MKKLLLTVVAALLVIACTRPNCQEMRDQLAKDKAALAALGTDNQPEAKARIQASIDSLTTSIAEHCPEEELLGLAQ